MQTHQDEMHNEAKERFLFESRLEERARKWVREANSTITAGSPGEPIVAQWKVKELLITQRPSDEQEILRIGVGGGSVVIPLNYCVFRGDRTRCAYLLEQAAKALREGPI